MNKEEFIKTFGEVAWRVHLDKRNKRRNEKRQESPIKAREEDKRKREKYPKSIKNSNKRWSINNPKKEEIRHHERNRKTGRFYKQKLEYNSTGLQKEKLAIRHKHGAFYRPYKHIIAPESQLHHEWIPNSAGFRGVALVEKDQHQHGYIDVIQILEGEITLLSEVEIRNNEEMSE